MRTDLEAIWKARWGYVAILPTFAFLGIFLYYPFLQALIRGFYTWDGFGALYYVGLDNFRELFTDEIFRLSLRNVAILLAAALLKVATVPFFLAEAIYAVKNRALSYVYRVLLVMPTVIPLVVMVLLWRFFYEPQFGLFNQLLRLVGLGSLARRWLVEYSTALPSIIFFGFPWVDGIAMLIYLAGLQNVEPSIIDAAKIDGAVGLRRVRYIDLSLLSTQFRVLIVLVSVSVIQDFVVVFLLTQGGPADYTMVPGLYLYRQAFRYYRFGYGSSVGFVLFIIILGLTFINMRIITGHRW